MSEEERRAIGQTEIIRLLLDDPMRRAFQRRRELFEK